MSEPMWAGARCATCGDTIAYYGKARGWRHAFDGTSALGHRAVPAPDQPSYGDHPWTDPGDGRTECETCGKWVHEVIHSCKGVPVTPAALDRATRRTEETKGNEWGAEQLRLRTLERDDLRRQVAALEAERGDWQANARIEVYDRLGTLRLERDRAQRQVAAVREALASIEYNARSALAALDRGSFNREDASLRADYEWFATTAGAVLDTASEDRRPGEDAAALQESEFAAGLFTAEETR